LLAAGAAGIYLASSGGDSIRRSEYLEVDGARLYLLVRGADAEAPVLLWLHGGPGGAERPLFRYFNGRLEKYFVVVYWDQRGAGRSFDAKADPRHLTIAQQLADLDQLVNHLRLSLHREKIILIGHSWGAALGLLYTQAHPDKLSAFVAVNPLISTQEQQRAEHDFIYTEASRRQDNTILDQLGKIGSPPYATARNVLAMERLVQRYGGIYYTEPNRLWVMIRGIASGLVGPLEIARIIKGNNVSLETMHQELQTLDLRKSVETIDVPVLMFLGRHDRHAEAQLAAGYFEDLHAPMKKLVWFEQSAHNVPFEEPALFNAAVVRELRAVGVDLPSGKESH